MFGVDSKLSPVRCSLRYPGVFPNDVGDDEHVSALGSLLACTLHDLILTHPLLHFHVILCLYQPYIVHQKQFGILEKRLGVRSIGCLSTELSP